MAGILGMSSAVGLPVILRLLGVFPENGNSLVFPILCGLKGFSDYMSAIMVVSISSSLADMTVEHELMTGRRQEGVFFASRSFIGKLTTGLRHLLVSVGTDLIAFPTDSERGEIAPEILTQFGILAGPVTILPALVSIFFYRHYKIDETRHNAIRAALKTQNERLLQQEEQKESTQ